MSKFKNFQTYSTGSDFLLQIKIYKRYRRNGTMLQLK